MCFGGSDDSSSKQMVQMQQDEAAQARQKEADRQGRINSGLARIKAAFEGSPVTGSRSKTYTAAAPAAGTASGSAVSGLPSGYTYVQKTTAPSAAQQQQQQQRVVSNNAYGPGGMRGNTSGGTSYSGSQRNQSGAHYAPSGVSGGAPAAGGGTSKWVIRGPNGQEYEIGQSVTGDESYDTGATTGGIGADFYDKYKQGVLDYYMPQVAEKYGDAKKELTYRLARAGTLRSSMAGEETADLAKQNDLNEGKIRSQADTAAADLKGRVASEKTKAEQQLYATENPDVAANQATAAISNITAEKPDTTPLGDIFSLATVGGANYLKGAQNQNLGKTYVPGWKKATSVVG
jgi:hypothetical protein